MKVIIDTNILVSAAIADKNPEAVILFVIANSAYEDYGTDNYNDKIRKNCQIVGEIAEKYGSPFGTILTN